MRSGKSAFERKLFLKCKNSLKNNFGKENYDEERYGQLNEIVSKPFAKFKPLIKKTINYYPLRHSSNYKMILSDFGLQFEKIYSQLDVFDKDLFVDILAFRILGFKHVKLPINNDFYFESLSTVDKLKNENDFINPKFLHFILYKFDLKSIGYDIKIYFSVIGVVIEFILEQYTYKINSRTIVAAENGDVVLDIGGCWGDTALYFANKVGAAGKVFSFEFIPGNINIFRKNLSLNPTLAEQIQLVPSPVSDTSDQLIHFKDNGPGSTIKFQSFAEQTGEAHTISIDDFVVKNKIQKINFIKMDIEGAEPQALEGAVNTIRRFKPKLAIAIYHSLDDFANIPNWILDLKLGYKIYLGHYTIHSEETVIFAKAE